MLLKLVKSIRSFCLYIKSFQCKKDMSSYETMTLYNVDWTMLMGIVP